MKLQILFTSAVFLIISGCSFAPTPQNAAEFRKVVADGTFGSSLETIEIKRPYYKVARTLKKKSKECLNIKLIKTKCVNRSCTDYHDTYTPTILSKKNKTEIHVQWERDPWNAIGSGEPPAKGMYIGVFDVVPDGKNKTKLTVYGPSIEHLTTVHKAVKHWADGSNLGCPDLTQAYYY